MCLVRRRSSRPQAPFCVLDRVDFGSSHRDCDRRSRRIDEARKDSVEAERVSLPMSFPPFPFSPGAMPIYAKASAACLLPCSGAPTLRAQEAGPRSGCLVRAPTRRLLSRTRTCEASMPRTISYARSTPPLVRGGDSLLGLSSPRRAPPPQRGQVLPAARDAARLDQDDAVCLLPTICPDLSFNTCRRSSLVGPSGPLLSPSHEPVALEASLHWAAVGFSRPRPRLLRPDLPPLRREGPVGRDGRAPCPPSHTRPLPLSSPISCTAPFSSSSPLPHRAHPQRRHTQGHTYLAY
ncbi:hypothetical protein FB451DRAFT_1461103 [Mycena latifolia]|nr:hypothetical protein FB451DRAFT_1461103 [Mycena latifolia]